MSVTELVNKSTGSSISSSELDAFIIKHNRQAFYRLGDNKHLTTNYKFNDNKTVIVNLDSIYQDENNVFEEDTEDDDVNNICTLDIKFVNKFKREFPDNNGNNWLVGTQKLSFFKNETLMYYH